MTFANLPIAGGAFADPGPPGTPASTAPSLQDLLTSGDYVIAAEQHFTTIGTDFEHILIVCGGSKGRKCPGFTTLSTDAPANYEVAPILDGSVQVTRNIAITENSSLTGTQSGEISLIVPRAGVYLHTVGQGNALEPLTLLRSQRQCAGRPFYLKIGRPEFGYASFHTVFETVAESLEPDGPFRQRLRLRDQASKLDQGILAVWSGTGGEQGTAELAGEVRSKHYGAPRNLSPRLALPSTLTYHGSDRTPTTGWTALYDGGVALVEDTAGYPFANWAAFQAYTLVGSGNSWVQYQGWVRTEVLPLGQLTGDLGDTMTVPQMIRTMLEEAGIDPAAIYIETEDYDYGVDNSRSEEWQAVAQMLETAPAQAYLSQQGTVLDAVDRLAKRHGFSRYQDRDQRICFAIADYRLNSNAIAGVDYTVIDADDAIEIEPTTLPSSIWPPRFREFLLYDQNHTILQGNQIFADASDSFRQRAVVPGSTLYVPDVTPDNSPVKAGLPSAVDPERNDTALIQAADAQALGEWFQLRSALSRATGSQFLSQRSIYKLKIPLSTAYGIDFMRNIKIWVRNYWPDYQAILIGQFLPPSEMWSGGSVEVDFLAYGIQYISVYVGSANIGALLPVTNTINFGPLFSGSYAYLLSGNNLVSLYLNGIQLTVADSLAFDATGLGSSNRGLSKYNQYIYVSFSSDGVGPKLKTFDAENPNSISYVGEVSYTDTTNSGLRNGSIINQRLYATELGSPGYWNVRAFDLSDPASPTYIGTVISDMARITGIRAIYTSSAGPGYLVFLSVTQFFPDPDSVKIYTYDLTDPDAPVLSGELDVVVPGYPIDSLQAYAYDGRYLYLQIFSYVTEETYYQFIATVDLTDPANPSVLAVKFRSSEPIADTEGYRRLLYNSSYLYAYPGKENGTTSLNVADVYDSSQPGELEYVTTIRADRNLVALGKTGIGNNYIYDFTNTTNVLCMG